jgi:YesN/AraC family two-component response regulator
LSPSEKTSREAVLSYIEAHYGEAMTLSDVAAAVSFSPPSAAASSKRSREDRFSNLQSYRLSKGTELLLAGASP